MTSKEDLDYLMLLKAAQQRLEAAELAVQETYRADRKAKDELAQARQALTDLLRGLTQPLPLFDRKEG